MDKIVIDTNVLISALLFSNSVSAKAVRKAFSEYEVCASKETEAEFLEVAKRQKFCRYFTSEQERQEFIDDFISQFDIFNTTQKITDCQDPKDNKFLEIALSVNAKLLITGDKKDLISMNPFRGLEIITVREFLEKY